MVKPHYAPAGTILLPNRPNQQKEIARGKGKSQRNAFNGYRKMIYRAYRVIIYDYSIHVNETHKTVKYYRYEVIHR